MNHFAPLSDSSSIPQVGSGDSFESKVLWHLATLTATVDGVKQGLDEVKAVVKTSRDDIKSLEIAMAANGDVKSNLEAVTKRVTAIEKTKAAVRGGYKAVAAIASAVVIALTAIYHLLGIGKLLEAAVTVTHKQ